MSKNNGKSEKYVDDMRQEARKQTCSEWLYDSRDGSIFGRTTKSWGQLFLFYLIFYIILAILFAICMQGLLHSVDDKQPKWKLHDSLIGTNPGLGFRPISDQTERGSVISYNKNKPKEIEYWTKLIDEFLEPYNNTTGSPMRPCTFQQKHDVCLVDLDKFGPCSAAEEYGFKTGEPCIFLKLNKIFGWTPRLYVEANATMPIQLQTAINNTDVAERQQIWVSCNGHYGKDKEHFQNITYYPRQGFPSYYYPYLNQPGYLSPVVAVQINKPAPGRMLDIECRAWADNILYSGSLRDRMGSVTFQIMVDSSAPNEKN